MKIVEVIMLLSFGILFVSGMPLAFRADNTQDRKERLVIHIILTALFFLFFGSLLILVLIA